MRAGSFGKNRSAWLTIAAAVSGAVVLWLGMTGGPEWASVRSGAAGCLLALILAAGTSIASSRAASHGPLASFKVSLGGVVARMLIVGVGVVIAATRPWFRPVPFVAAFGILFFTTGLWLVLTERNALRLSTALPGRHGIDSTDGGD
jgi:hypothetical protein